MVVANSVAALSEIKEKNCDFVENMNSEILFKLLSALDDCTE
jgi:hypothetical protein